MKFVRLLHGNYSAGLPSLTPKEPKLHSLRVLFYVMGNIVVKIGSLGIQMIQLDPVVISPKETSIRNTDSEFKSL